MDRTTLIERIEAHAKATKLKASTICQYAIQNRNFYQNLLDGKDYQIGTATRLLDWLSSADGVEHSLTVSAVQPVQSDNSAPQSQQSVSGGKQ